MNRLDEVAIKTGPVVITDAQERWVEEFKDKGGQLRKVLGSSALRIDHIGSTSVPGLAAKDIIDIQVTVASLDDLSEFDAKMRSSGYQRRGEFHYDCLVGIDDPYSPQLRKAYFREPEGTRRHHIHIRQKGLMNQRYALLFRDYLRANETVKIGYETIKRRLTEIFPESIGGYLYIKDPLMDIIYQGAESWATTVGWSEDALYL